MTTFTSEDRIAAMNEPVVIVDSGASVPRKPEPMTHAQAEVLLAAYGGSFALIRAVEKHHGVI
jgi:hypothetical protein